MSCCLRMKWQKSQLSSKAPKIALDIRANALSYFPPLTSNIAAQATPPTWRSKAMCCMLTSLERQPLPPPPFPPLQKHCNAAGTMCCPLAKDFKDHDDTVMPSLSAGESVLPRVMKKGTRF